MGRGRAVNTDAAPRADGLVEDPSQPYGYRRPPELQAQFDAAAATLLSHGYQPPGAGAPELVADLAIEGGGVKGIGIVGAVSVLAEAGYRFERVAGTSAGAIGAALIAAITQAGRPMTSLKGYMDEMHFKNFMREGVFRPLFIKMGKYGKVPGAIADALVLTHRQGLYSGDYLATWMRPILKELGVCTYENLRITNDPGSDLPPDRNFRLLVHTSDISRKELVRIPWDLPYYGVDPASQDVVQSVRASMSIPFFFKPVQFTAHPATVDVPVTGGGRQAVAYGGGTVSFVDGGMLRNFPIAAFDRTDGKEPRWPTIGIKLSSLQETYDPTNAVRSSVGEMLGALHTMMNEWDAYSVQPATAARTIFIDNDGLTATDFNLLPAQQTSLFLNGVAAATQFVIQTGAYGTVPKSAAEGLDMVRKQNGALGAHMPVRYH